MHDDEKHQMTVGVLREALANLPAHVPVNISVSNADGDGVLSIWNFDIADYTEGGEVTEGTWVELVTMDEDNTELCPAELTPGVLR